MDLKLLGIMLRSRWLWLHRAEPQHPWAALPVSEDAQTTTFFNVSIQMILGNGKSIFSWSDPWL
jgi:hypothetical protein